VRHGTFNAEISAGSLLPLESRRIAKLLLSKPDAASWQHAIEIDMEAGALMETLLQLPMQFGIPDLLYYEEIEPGSPGLEGLRLQIMEVSGDLVAYAQQLPGQHSHLACPWCPLWGGLWTCPPPHGCAALTPPSA